MKDLNATFTAEVSGDVKDSFYVSCGTKNQLRFKAINKIAREHAKQQNQEERASKQQLKKSPTSRSSAQQNFYQQHVARQKQTQIDQGNEATKHGAAKRPITQAKTGLTPETKKRDDRDASL
eukprot:s1307_g5.t1